MFRALPQIMFPSTLAYSHSWRAVLAFRTVMLCVELVP
jgi:hypothetical protein